MIDELKPYPEMRPSGLPWLGDVPAHWEIRKLRNCGTIIGGLTPSMADRSLWDGDVPWVTPKDMKRFTISSASMNVSIKALEATSLQLVPAKSVLMVVRGMILARRVPIAWTNAPVTINQDMKALVPTSEFDAAFFAYRMDAAQENFFPMIDEAGHGTKRFPTERWKGFQVAIPPLHEQQLITRFLDWHGARTAKLIRSKKTIAALLSDRKQILINKAITRGFSRDKDLRDSGVLWLGDVPNTWEIKRLKWVTRLQRGYDLPAEKRVAGPYPVVSSGGVIDWHNDCKSRAPGVVMGRYGSTEAVFYIEEDFWPHNTSLFVTDFQGNNPRWCYYLLRSISKADHSGKSAVPGVDRKDLFDIMVALPTYDEQMEIVSGIEKRTKEIDKSIHQVEQEITLIQEFRTRLIADVVTGKLDVRVAAASLPAVAEAEPADALADEDDLDEPADAFDNEVVAA